MRNHREIGCEITAKPAKAPRNHPRSLRGCEILPARNPFTFNQGSWDLPLSRPPLLLMGLENLFTLISRAPYFCPSVLQFIVAPRNPRNRRETCETAAKSGEITAKPLAKSP